MSVPPRPHPPSPFDQSAAWAAANSSGVWPALFACASSIHGRNSAGERPGKVRQRLVRSPFGSIASTGSPARSASSIRITPRPVLPEPVMPTITPWVVSESVSTIVWSAASPDTRSCVAASTAPPRKRSAMGPDSRGRAAARPAVPLRDGIPWVPGGGVGVLRAAGGRQLQGVLAGQQAPLRRVGEAADGGAHRGTRRLRAVPHVPAAQRPALLQEQAALQDAPGRL